ncbi:glutathione peroxidase [Sporolactobacillus spathodeae]|uniref:Glutathione peroxidase n=1 Tax=Sporolactobacillus spathodeae TaxID=1465502 RepID=A0ABS2Q7S2_9BACL|nr:glutathione peroxidase [Sporolactobacillus spathodeae]MBM7657027.1 glutathione peroxidase [Sporolactobacillus spathodeae]
MGIYDYTVKDLQANNLSMAAFKDKVLLIVNTATQCGFTPQYEGLQKLYENYQAKGLEILDFPCDQFAHQAPGSNEEINQFCTLRYHTTFPRFAKIDVNGNEADPLYNYLKEQKGGLLSAAIKWNFTKFLVDRTGNVVERYASTVKPEQIAKKIEELLKQPVNG